MSMTFSTQLYFIIYLNNFLTKWNFFRVTTSDDAFYFYLRKNLTKCLYSYLNKTHPHFTVSKPCGYCIST